MAKAIKEKEEKLSYEKLVEQLNKKYSSTEKEYFDLSTGSLGLDIILGGKGLRSGRIVEVIAWEGAGKTTLCLHLIAEAQKRKMKVAYIDAEHALSREYAENIGTNWEDLKPTLFQPSNGEEAFEYAKTLINSGELKLCIFDSTSGMLPKKQMEDPAGSSNLGLHARLFSSELPKINLAASNNNCLVVFVSQLREKIGVMFGSPEVTQAGNALKFWASTRLDLRKTLDKEGDDVIGLKTKFKVLKNKTASPYQIATVPIVFGVGFDKIQELIEMADENEIIKVWGKSVTFEETKYTLEDFKELLQTNEEFFNDIREKTIEKILHPEIKIKEEPIMEITT